MELDLYDGNPPLLLWYPTGALRELCEKAEIEVDLTQVSQLIQRYLTPKTLLLYVWAGRLWEERGLLPESLRERVEYSSRRPVLEISALVRRAIVRSLSGDVDDDAGEEPKEGADPPPPTALNGEAGPTSSATPSGT